MGEKGCDEDINDQYFSILEDISVSAADIKDEQQYKTLYYSTSLTLRNKGNLTLLNPVYCPLFSKLLFIINQAREYGYKRDSGKILDREKLIQSVKIQCESGNGNPVDYITEVIKERINGVQIKDIEIDSLIWEIIIKVTNAIVGDTVRNYRSTNLARVNSVAFRTEIAVKSEKKYTKK